MFLFELNHPTYGLLRLENPPIGWEDIELDYKRDKKYHGIGLEIGLDLEFPLEGAAYIEQVYKDEKIRGKIDITIYEYDTETYTYEPFYKGKLDLKAYARYSKDGADVVKANIIPASTVQTFLTQDDVLINLQKLTALNGSAIAPFAPEVQNVELHSRVIIMAYEATVKDQAQGQIISFETNPEQRTPAIYFGFDEEKQNDLGFTNLGTTYTFSDDVLDIWTSTVRGKINFEFRLNTRLYIEAVKGDFDNVKVRYFFQINRLNKGPEVILLAEDENTGVEDKYRRDIDTGVKQFSSTIEIGDKVYLYGLVDVTEVSGAYRLDYRVNLLNGSYFKTISETQTNATNARGVLLHEAFSRVCQSITGKPFAFYSEYFGRQDSQPVQYNQDGEGSLALLSNGFQLRGFPLADKPIFTSLTNLYSGLDAIHNLGAGVEKHFNTEVLRVEPKSYFYQEQVVLDLGSVTDFKESVALDTYYSTADIGYQQWRGSDNDNQGLDEINTKHNYVLPHPEIKSTYSALSPLITSGYNIEMVRRNQYVAGAQKDDNKDDSSFLISLVRANGAYVTERNQNLAQSTGIFSPDTLYNIRLSPTRNAKRHANIFTAGLKSTEKARFNFGEGLYKVSSRLTTELEAVSEDQDIVPVKSLWGNEQYEFECLLDKQKRQIIQQNPYGCYAFSDCEGETKYGYILSLKTKLKEGTGSFTLIRANR